ncbi:hypothetical protein [Nocardiopsis potens]|uniref:hypothetical protein n=1 Tax=Nocardiopsis potens TaxID=1246458 RepID=UPI00034D5B0B|nr:hypothetical protein [Nocardiopsis potens]
MNVYDIRADAAGIAAPDTVEPGAATFRIRSEDPEGAWLGLVRLVDGVSLEQYLDDLKRAYGYGPEAIAASRVLDGQGIMLGGAAVTGDVPVSYTQLLSPGTYHFIDYKRILGDGPAAKVHSFTVGTGPASMGSEPSGAEVAVVQVNTAAGPRYQVPQEIRSGTPLRVTNRLDQYNEAVLMGLKDGARGSDVEDFFAAISDGRQPPVPDLIRSGPVGCVPLSPGRSAVVSADLPPGRYVLTSWVTDHDNGRKFPAEGMYALVTIV